MRLPPEITASVGIAAVVTVAYVPLATGGAPAASGLVGHLLGVFGFAAMLAGSLGYSWRKRPGRSGPGSMQRWLQAHVVSGLVGPYLVLLHTTFAFRGLAGITFLLLLVVVASGLVGRFVYTRVPKFSPHAARAIAELARVPALPLASAGGGATAAVLERRALAALDAERRLGLGGARSALRTRRRLALWWVLHVPLALAMFALAIVHVMAAIYYATLLR